jgi:sulfite exporter TauE/SafE
MTAFLLFAGGLAGSLHCAGMCGGFALALGAHGTRPVARQLLYNLARVNTLIVIGALSGALGAGLVRIGPLPSAERALAAVAALFMLAVGLEMLGLLRRWTPRGTALVQATAGRALAGVLRSPSPAAPLAFGIFNCFLPCQLVYAVAARAASTGSVADGMLTMLWFGLGTVPAMVALGSLRRWLAPALRGRVTTVSGVLVLAFAAITLWRAIAPAAHCAQ